MVADTWDSPDPPADHRFTWAGLIRAVLRGLPLLVLTFGGLVVLLAVRLIERPIFGPRRPWTPHITQFVCRGAFVILGIRRHTIGDIMPGPGAVVANHCSWLDIFTLNAAKRVYFVAKSEVANWPGIGWLARATGTVFIRREKRSEAAAQVDIFRDRLAVGHKLLFFPEGTSTDGKQVLAFKPTLFAAFFDPAIANDMAIQPVTLRYKAPPGADPRFYAWWGDMSFGRHLWSTLAAARQGAVTVIYHTPCKLTDFDNRKTLAKALEDQVRAGLTDHDLM